MSRFFRNVTTLATGTTVSQFIPVLFSPILTRIYTPAEFGIYAIYAASVIFLSTVATGRYELAILIPEEKEEANQLLNLALLVCFLSCVMVGLLVFFAALGVKIYLYKGVPDWMLFTPFGGAALGGYQVLILWFNRLGDYKAISYMRISQALLIVSFSLVFGVLDYSKYGLIFSHVFGYFLVFFGGVAIKKINLMPARSPSSLSSVARKYIKFPRYLAFAHGMNRLSAQMPVYVLGTYFGTAAAGYYGLMDKSVSSPTSVISGSIANVFRKDASEEIRKHGKCTSSYKKTVFILAAICFLPFLVLYFWGGPIFSFVFGPQWEVAGQYASIMVVFFFCRFSLSPVHSVFMLAGHQKTELYWQIALFFLIVAALLFGALYLNVFQTLMLYTYVFSGMLVISAACTYRFSKSVSLIG